ncbi:hypothetical protein K2173_027541 [Erythroxylum novogranatense]|uniref:non-specific serine/threonine protein kinase n=1 Tax=Erythroxylum novogranatense TaxID=1862640 RepID=A0AAV8U2K4_9ROSI|nr:hypothetical protein K2173_027541 [Erythroxylum novogranatense]
MLSASEKKTLHSLLSSNLKKLTITPPNSTTTTTDLEFNDLFGPWTPHRAQSPSSSSFPVVDNPPVIHNRSHSYVGPSPRYPTSSSTFPFQIQEDDDDDDDDDEGGGSGVSAEEDEGKSEKVMLVGDKIGPSDFEILRVIGQGAFGKVFQVRKKLGADLECNDCGGDGIYAMKVMRKDTIIKKNHVDYMKAERDILTKVVHPFIVHLRYSFQTKSKLYLILDFINGGHLFFHLYRQGIFGSHLHKSGIVHRDLKPENILMDADGHEIDEASRSNSLCGTTEYMAPEILLSKGHNKNADWWSVGILLYEMLTGQVISVFSHHLHSNRKKLQERIVKEKVKLPPYLSSEAHSLLKGLLQKEPSSRLGSGPVGGDEIKQHKWFRSINWKKLEARELEPKFKPDVSGKDCTANFDKCWTTMPPDDSPASTPTEESLF